MAGHIPSTPVVISFECDCFPKSVEIPTFFCPSPALSTYKSQNLLSITKMLESKLKNYLGQTCFETSFEDKLGYLEAQMQQYNNFSQIRENFELMLQLVKSNKVDTLVLDVSKVRVPWIQANDWIEQSWVPRATNAGLKHFLLLVSKDKFSQLSGQDLMQRFLYTTNGLQFLVVDTAEEMLETLIALKAKLVKAKSPKGQ